MSGGRRLAGAQSRNRPVGRSRCAAACWALRVGRLWGSWLLGARTHELRLRGFGVEQQRVLPVFYTGVRFEHGYRLDIVVDDWLLIEARAVERLLPVHEAQALTYLKLTGLPVVLLVNFNVEVLKRGLRRLTNKSTTTVCFPPSRLPV
ncbi:MAG: GxxExxY protein [Deltaproteobacteria bacterium]|nr:GxxExxY protein [Deltaproteobacteria bacterium]